jgi:FlaA1/EpsC-like NDP-sugar epimerase
MGEPVSIVELAYNLLALSGYDPSNGDDGPGIVYTGLRPGERLHETLVEADEVAEPSANPLIRKARPATEPMAGAAAADAATAVPRLLDLAARGAKNELRGLLAELLGSPTLRAPTVTVDPFFAPDQTPTAPSPNGGEGA